VLLTVPRHPAGEGRRGTNPIFDRVCAYSAPSRKTRSAW
jgi:hypothetical protein